MKDKIPVIREELERRLEKCKKIGFDGFLIFAYDYIDYVEHLLFIKKIIEKEEEDFERVFKQKELPKDIPWFEVGTDEKTLPRIMLDSGMAASASAAKRLIEQGGVTIDGKKVSDPNIKPKEGVIKVGRKFIKLLLKKK